MMDHAECRALAAVLLFSSYSWGAVIFVDNQLAADCIGTYSIAQRDGTGHDGNAYTTPQKAANSANPGDIIYFRAGTYYQPDTADAAVVMNILRSGTSANPITFKNYSGEEVIFSAYMPSRPTLGHFYAVSLGVSCTVAQDPSGTGVQNIVLDGFVFTGASRRGLVIFGPVHRDGVVENPSANIVVRNCVFRDNQGVQDQGGGLATYGTVINSTIQDCEAYHNTGAGIFLSYIAKDFDVLLPDEAMNGARNCRILRCLVYDNTQPSSPGNTDGIVAGFTYGTIIEDCISFHNGDDAFDIYASRGATIKDCIAFNHNTLGDGNKSGFKFSAGGGGAHTLIGNIAFNNDGHGFEGSPPNFPAGQQDGPLSAGGSEYRDYRPSKLYGNIAYDNRDDGFLFGDHHYHTDTPGFDKEYVYNNIASHNPPYDMINAETGYIASDYNLIGKALDLTAMQRFGGDTHSLTGDPRLTSPGIAVDTTFPAGWTLAQKREHIRTQVRRAFSPLKGSPVVDTGKTVSGYHNPTAGDNSGSGRAWYGTAPDIGAYEVALSSITDLSISSTSQNSVTLLWTVPGGSNYRQPTQYDIRYAAGSITESNWDTATRVPGAPVPGDLGMQQSFTIAGLNPGSPYGVAMKTGDEQGNISWLSNGITAATTTSGNHAPVLAAIADQLASVDQALTFPIRATDADAGDTLTYSATSLPPGANFDPATQSFTWIPLQGQSGTYHATFQVTDSHISISQTVGITVRNTINHAPMLAPIGNQAVNENTLSTFSVSATDEDGDVLRYSATGLPSGASFADRVFRWTPNHSQAGAYQVTFTVSDGELTDSEPITITVANVTDETAPVAHDFSPATGAFQVPPNTLIALALSDGGSGVDGGTVAIQVNNQLVYSGNSSLYQSTYGTCRRAGTPASYRYYYQPAQAFDFDERVAVTVTASDIAHNTMTPLSYQFVTEMRSFGQNQPVSSENDTSGHPALATDSQGNLWTSWHAGQVGARDIYVARRGNQLQEWDTPVRLTTVASDRCNPALAIGPDNALYLVWQDNRRGNWDIYASVSADGAAWSDPIRVTDSNDNQTNPVIALDQASPYRVYVAWERGNPGDRDIYLASCSASFVSKTIARVTSDPADQAEPALAVGSDNTVYLLWTDQRNGSADIYGSSSAAPSWSNIAVVTGPGNQSHPAVAVAPGTSTLHVAWQSDAAGNMDVLYGTAAGLPANSFVGSSLVDDTTGTDQSAPSIMATRDYANNVHVYACWQDNRMVGSTRDNDVYVTEIRSGAGRTNILVGDDGTNSDQSDPALGRDEYGQPVIVWTDGRSSVPRIYSASSIYVKPATLASGLIPRATGGRVGVDPASIDAPGEVSIQIPANACDCDVTISVSEIQNFPRFPALCVAGYEIGPSGVQFAVPATVTIPYTGAATGRTTPYWYDTLTATLSQQGMTEITFRTLANGTPVVSFKTTHLTPFYILEGAVAAGSSGGGGCALAGSQEGSAVGFLLPYAALALFLLMFKRRDRRYEET